MKFAYESLGVKTEYRGTRYRSKTEARWAAFFHHTNVAVEYEPYRVGGWLPDFVTRNNAGGRTLIEVKPIRCLDLWLPIDSLPRDQLGQNDNLGLLGLGLLNGHEVLEDYMQFRRRAPLQQKTVERRYKDMQLGWRWISGAWEPWFPKPERIFRYYRAWLSASSAVPIYGEFFTEDETKLCVHDRDAREEQRSRQAALDAERKRERDLPQPQASCGTCRRTESSELRVTLVPKYIGNQRIWIYSCEECYSRNP